MPIEHVNFLHIVLAYETLSAARVSLHVNTSKATYTANFFSVICSQRFFLLMLQGTPVNIIIGSHVWVQDPAVAWIDGQVTKITGENVELQTSNGKTVSRMLI